MPILVPQEKRIITNRDETYSIPIHILSKRPLTMGDELLLQEMVRYKPATHLRSGDIVLLSRPPQWVFKRKDEAPRMWKVRWIVTYWAWRIMDTVFKTGRAITLDEAVRLLESASNFSHHRAQEPMVMCTGFPQGDHKDTAEWLPQQLLRRTTSNDENEDWPDITEQAGTHYYGYASDKPFELDLAPDAYSKGRSLGRPFKKEEALYHDFCLQGFEEIMKFPHRRDNQHKLPRVAHDHDKFATKEK